MLLIYPVNFNTSNKNIPVHNSANLKNSVEFKSHAEKNFALYPVGLYSSKININFTGGRTMLSLKEQSERLSLESLTPIISNSIQSALNSKTDKNLYDIHTEIFTPLLECQSLEEAKNIYPEFKDVIDAKDLPEYLMSPTLKKIKNGEIEGVTLENLTLSILKIHYGKGIGLSSRNNFFGLSKDATIKLLNDLNIKRLDGKYLRLLSDCSLERRAKTSKSWSEEKRAEHARKANKIWSDRQRRQTQSDKRKEWFQNHPEAAAEISKRMQGTTLSPETREKISQSKKAFYQHNPEFAQLRSESFERCPEFKLVMQKVAKEEFPYLRIILLKQAAGEPLEDYEINYLERYHKRCEELYPGGQKIVGKLFSEMWQEFKDKKEQEESCYP